MQTAAMKLGRVQHEIVISKMPGPSARNARTHFFRVRAQLGARQKKIQLAEAFAVPHFSRSDVSSFRNSRPSTAYPIPAIRTMTTTT